MPQAPENHKPRRSTRPKPQSVGQAITRAGAQSRHTQPRSRQQPVGDRPADRARDLRRAETFKRTAPYREAQRVATKVALRRAFRQAARMPRVDDQAPWPVRERAPVKVAGLNGPRVARSTVVPVLKILDQTTRPLHAIAGAERAVLLGKGNPGKEFVKGARLQTRYGSADILHDVFGVPKKPAAIAGFAGDVVGDPTTYVTFGAGSLARHGAEQAAQSAARSIARKALKSGLTHEQATRMGQRAYAQTLARARQRTGGYVSAGIGGKRVAIPVRRTGRAVPGAARARRAVSHVRPTMRASADTDAVQFASARQVERRARAASNDAIRVARETGRRLKRDVKPEDHGHFIAALESGSAKGLPKYLREPGADGVSVWKRERDMYRYWLKERRRAGVSTGDIGNYFPHKLDSTLREGKGAAKPGGVGRPASSLRRQDRQSLATANLERVGKGREPFSTDVPLVGANYVLESARAVAHSRALRGLADVGRSVKPGAVVKLKKNEAIYRIGGQGRGKFGIDEVSADDLERLAREGPASQRSGRFVVLDREAVNAVENPTRGMADRNAATVAIDKATGWFKRLATFTPAFHLRNLIGDTQMAWIADGQNARKLASDVRTSMKGIGHLHAQEAGRGVAKDIDVKVAGKTMKLSELVAHARREGVVRTGYQARELRDLSHVGQEGLGRVRSGRVARAGSKAAQVLEDREDLMRLATYKHFLDQGLDPAKAADRALGVHIDYGDLSRVEREWMRRILPFYTFSARAIPFHAQRLTAKPGKFATYAKAMEASNRLAGVGPTELHGESEFKQRGAGLAVGGALATLLRGGAPLPGSPNVQYASAALPLTLVNELPTSLDPGAYGKEVSRYFGAMVNPFLKTPMELKANYSLFFGNQIKTEQRPQTKIPGWAAQLGRSVPEFGEWMRVDRIKDKRSGKMVPGGDALKWYAIQSALAGPLGFASGLTQETTRRGQGRGTRVLGFLSGVKLDESDQITAAIDGLYQAQESLKHDLGRMNQEGKTFGKDYRAKNAELDRVNKALTALSIKRGDSTPIGGKTRAGSRVVRSQPSAGFKLGGAAASSSGFKLGGR